jgi:hypothetical protein
VSSDRRDPSEAQNRRILLAVSGGALIVMALSVSVLFIPVGARWMAVRQMDAGAVSEAQQWLRRAALFPFGQHETELLRAIGYRRLGR